MEATLPPMLPDAEAHASPPASLMLACSRRRETTRLAILRKSDISGQAIRQRENINRINIALILTWQWVGRSPALPVSVVRVCLIETRHTLRGRPQAAANQDAGCPRKGNHGEFSSRARFTRRWNSWLGLAPGDLVEMNSEDGMSKRGGVRRQQRVR